MHVSRDRRHMLMLGRPRCCLLFYLFFSAECSAATGANVKESCINLVTKIHHNNQTEMSSPVEAGRQQKHADGSAGWTERKTAVCGERSEGGCDEGPTMLTAAPWLFVNRVAPCCAAAEPASQPVQLAQPTGKKEGCCG